MKKKTKANSHRYVPRGLYRYTTAELIDHILSYEGTTEGMLDRVDDFIRSARNRCVGSYTWPLDDAQKAFETGRKEMEAFQGPGGPGYHSGAAFHVRPGSTPQPRKLFGAKRVD
jgi:hypothetical protein